MENCLFSTNRKRNTLYPALQNIHPRSPMSNRFQFRFNSPDRFPCCVCSRTGPWSFYAANDQGSGKSKKDKHANKKIMPKCKKRVVAVNQRETVFSNISRTVAKSSFVGLNKIANSRTRLGKWIWGFLTIICISGFLYQVLKFILVYYCLPTEVTLRVENSGSVNFPAVTVCNNNRIRKSAYCKLNGLEICDSKLTLSESQILDTYIQALDDKSELKPQLGHSMQMIKGCIFKGDTDLNITECLKRFHPFFDPDLGNCFTFSSRDNKGEYLLASEIDFWHNANDLILLLDQQPEEYTEVRRQPSLFLTVHSDEFFPDPHTDAILVEGGSSYAFAVQQSVTMLLPHPFETNCTDFTALPWVSENSIPSSRICTVGCSRHFQFQDCNYVSSRLSLFLDKLPWDPATITEEHKKCADDVEAKTKSYCRSLCAVPCKDVQFEVAVAKTALVKTEVMEFYDEEINEKWKNYTFVKVFYKTIEKKMYEHIAMYDDLELFSYLGGYSGVWLGFSLLNFFELLEILVVTISAGCKAKSNSKNKKKKLRMVNCVAIGQGTLRGDSIKKATKFIKIVKKKTFCSCYG